jgi:hypothetical protein
VGLGAGVWGMMEWDDVGFDGGGGGGGWTGVCGRVNSFYILFACSIAGY